MWMCLRLWIAPSKMIPKVLFIPALMSPCLSWNQLKLCEQKVIHVVISFLWPDHQKITEVSLCLALYLITHTRKAQCYLVRLFRESYKEVHAHYGLLSVVTGMPDLGNKAVCSTWAFEGSNSGNPQDYKHGRLQSPKYPASLLLGSWPRETGEISYCSH